MSKAARRRRNHAQPPMHCEHCVGRGDYTHVRWAGVRVGSNGTWKRLIIDRWPHPDGRVVKDPETGHFTLLREGTRNAGGFRVHNEENCTSGDYSGLTQLLRQHVEEALDG